MIEDEDIRPEAMGSGVLIVQEKARVCLHTGSMVLARVKTDNPQYLVSEDCF